MNDCQFEGSQSVGAIVFLEMTQTAITNCTFSNNTGDHSVIVIDCNTNVIVICNIITNSFISHNNMTGITVVVGNSAVHFRGRNVIQNNRNTEGAGIILQSLAQIKVQGELLLYNNTADKHGGAILVKK